MLRAVAAWWSAALALAALLLPSRWRVSSAWLLPGGAAAGLLAQARRG